MEILRVTLRNGIRLVHHPLPDRVAHCGVFIGAGSRDEKETEHGYAHFTEHLVFKGTNHRNAYQILNRLDNVGADLNAFTTKEETCFHASFLPEYYERTLELLSDIVFHPTFPEKEIIREKQVVIDEIHAYKDSPAEQIFDDFEDLLFTGHPLGRNTLGSTHSIRELTRLRLLKFKNRNYNPEQMVVVSSGPIGWKKLVRLTQKYFEYGIEDQPLNFRYPVQKYNPFQKEVKRKLNQLHCIKGGVAYPVTDSRRIPMSTLNNLLGGPAMNTRLSLALREKRGLTYHIESAYTPFTDTGIFMIYFGTDKQKFQKADEIIERELKKMCTIALSPGQLHTIKKQITGQLAIASEQHLAVILSVGKSILATDTFEPLSLILEKINAITSSNLLEVANETVDPARLSMLTFIPV